MESNHCRRAGRALRRDIENWAKWPGIPSCTKTGRGSRASVSRKNGRPARGAKASALVAAHEVMQARPEWRALHDVPGTAALLLALALALAAAQKAAVSGVLFLQVLAGSSVDEHQPAHLDHGVSDSETLALAAGTDYREL